MRDIIEIKRVKTPTRASSTNQAPCSRSIPKGPILGDPTTSAEYREIIEAEHDDEYVVRSMIRGPDGEWFEFARAEYRRSE